MHTATTVIKNTTVTTNITAIAATTTTITTTVSSLDSYANSSMPSIVTADFFFSEILSESPCMDKSRSCPRKMAKTMEGKCPTDTHYSDKLRMMKKRCAATCDYCSEHKRTHERITCSNNNIMTTAVISGNIYLGQ